MPRDPDEGDDASDPVARLQAADPVARLQAAVRETDHARARAAAAFERYLVQPAAEAELMLRIGELRQALGEIIQAAGPLIGRG